MSSMKQRWMAMAVVAVVQSAAFAAPAAQDGVPATGGGGAARGKERVVREFRVPASTETVHLRVPVGEVAAGDRVGTTLVLTEVSQPERRMAPVVSAIGPDGLADSNRVDALVSIPPRAGAGAERRFVLAPGRSVEVPGPSSRNRLKFHEPDARTVSLSAGDGIPVFAYRHGIQWKEGVPRDRARSSYLHPLYGLDGEVLTDDFPDDHHHHRGVFWSWPHVGVGGKEYDLWMLKGIGHRFERFLANLETADAGAVLGVENGWYVGDTRVMRERVWITTFAEAGDGRAIDLDCTWIPGDQPVTLAGAEGKSYGGMTLRYAPGTNTVITTPRGNGTEDLYMTRLPWADLSRRWADSGKVSGAALMVAPDHPDYPPTWLTRHYGVLCLGWPGVKAQAFAPGVPIRCRYRIWVHRGEVGQARLEAVYRAYTDGWKPVE